MKKIIVVIIFSVLVTACSSEFEKSMRSGKDALKSGDTGVPITTDNLFIVSELAMYDTWRVFLQGEFNARQMTYLYSNYGIIPSKYMRVLPSTE